jgi:peptidoglycan/xylan/chitin deacetylase (PgdA/CDA1 family)
MPRVSACLSFDFDAMSVWINPFRARDLSTISRGEFGAVAIGRILSLLEDRGIRSTFFVPGHTACAFPELIEDIVAGGHEIGHHGWVHELPAQLDAGEERRAFERGMEVLEEIVGRRPVGYRAPGSAITATTVGLLVEHELLYDSSCFGDDLSPYYLRRGDRWSRVGPYAFGESCDVVEMPISWSRDDFPAFEFVPRAAGGSSSPSAVLEAWQGDFDYAHRTGGDALYTLVLHPQTIGRGHRILMLEALLDHMQAHEDVRFTTLADHAARWREANPLATWTADQRVHARARA